MSSTECQFRVLSFGVPNGTWFYQDLATNPGRRSVLPEGSVLFDLLVSLEVEVTPEKSVHDPSRDCV